MTIGDVEIYTVSLSDIKKHSAEILKDAKASRFVPLLSSLKVTSGFFGFGSSDVTQRYGTLTPNTVELWVFLALDNASVDESDKLAFAGSDYAHLKRYIH